jgi:nitronate monooxygenase
MARFDGREDALVATLDREREAYFAAVERDDFDTALVWAGEGVDLVKSVEPAAKLVRDIGAEAEVRLRDVASLLAR